MIEELKELIEAWTKTNERHAKIRLAHLVESALTRCRDRVTRLASQAHSIEKELSLLETQVDMKQLRADAAEATAIAGSSAAE